MARLTNHFENDSDTGDLTPIEHHDNPQNETTDENAPPQPPKHLIDPSSTGRHAAAATQSADTSSESTYQQGLSRDMLLLIRAVAVAGVIDTHSDSTTLLASPAAGPAPPPSVASEVAGDDDAFNQIGSTRLSSSRHSAKLSESLSSSSPRWSYENLRNQRWSYNSDVMERGVHDLKTLGEREGDGGIEGENGPDRSAATKDEMNLTVSVNEVIRERELRLIRPGLARNTRRKPWCNILQVALNVCQNSCCILSKAPH